MHLTKSDIFWKSWWWSLVFGAIVASIFYAITGLFRFEYPGTSFFDILISLSIVGCYFGAGYVGWRISLKYYHTSQKYIKLYRQYAIITFVILIGVVYSPLSFLSVLWSFIPPFCVLQALKHVVEETTPAIKPRRRKRQPARAKA
jgi:4-amino-4-deoxy-L-arabinose transferase-like glycosyltransferase